MEKRFADFHCHPHMRSFNWFRNTKVEFDEVNYHPWHIIASSKNKADQGKRAVSYSQSDLVKLVNGNVKLVFATFYPMEQGWFVNNDMPFKEVMKILFNQKQYKDLFWSALGALCRRDTSKVSLVQRLVEPLYMLIPPERIRYFRKSSYNYFDELIKEKAFLLAKSGVETESLLYPKFFDNYIADKPELAPFFKAKGTYQIAVNGMDAKAIIEEGKIAFVMILEGASAFNASEEVDTILKRVELLKSWHDAPIFYISFAHHFNNYLCGHARSLPDEGAFFINQTEGMNNGITTKGWAVIRQLLSLNENFQNEPAFGRRILIDVKHMNIISRNEYYRDVIQPRITSEMDTIPVIASHCCYSGVATIDKLIAGMHHENNNTIFTVNGNNFYGWNINLCDEEIRIIFASGGIIGLNFDQRVLGITGANKKLLDHFEFLWANLSVMADVILNSSMGVLGDKNASNVWDLFCIGSDFDGYIDPANGYSTALDFEKFHDKLVVKLSQPNNKHYLLNGLQPIEIANKVCYDNAYQLMMKHFKSFL